MLDVLISFFESVVLIVVNFVPNVINIISKGIEFLVALFSNVPNFITTNFISCLPPFFQTGFYGLLGIMLFILITKIIALIKF